MALSGQQLQTLKTFIAADPVMSLKPLNSDGDFDIAALLNAAASPTFYVWRTNVTRSEIYHGTSAEATTWNWTTYKAQSVGEQGAWTQIFMGDKADFSLANLRAGVVAIFNGAAAQQTHILAIAKRAATRIEKLFAVGTGSQAVPAVMAFEGPVSYNDVGLARSPP